MTDRILRFPEVKKLSGMSRSTIYLRITEGLFPRPIQLGTRMVGWRESEVATMNAARVRGAAESEIRELVVRLQSQRKDAA
ncbi:MAG TPA: AlpA family phage regulatory protein [Thermoanaerobaculia bacterium]|jgi:prophage regulatory protein